MDSLVGYPRLLREKAVTSPIQVIPKPDNIKLAVQMGSMHVGATVTGVILNEIVEKRNGFPGRDRRGSLGTVTRRLSGHTALRKEV